MSFLAQGQMEGASVGQRDEVTNPLNLEDDIGTRNVRY
jgi:hypothetical protein